MSTNAKIIAGAIVLLAVFFLGFVPQYTGRRLAETDLQTERQRAQSLQSQLRMAELRDLCSLMLLEVLRLNYGLAREHSTPYFERLRQAAEEQQDPSRREAFEELSALRDTITGLLSNSDPASSGEVQMLCRQTYELTRM